MLRRAHLHPVRKRGANEVASGQRARHHAAMGKLIYLLNVSVDGFVETTDRSLDWSVVDEESHQWFADRARGIAVSIYGRRLWEVMSAYWPTSDSDPNATPATREFGAIWRATPKVVFSSTLSGPLGSNARLASSDPATELARIRAETDGDIELGGPTTAAEFIRRDLVDEYGLVVHPVVLGSGTPFFPPDAGRLPLRLVATHRFASGVVYLGYERDRS